MRKLLLVLFLLLLPMSSWAQMPNRKVVLEEERAKFGAMLNAVEAGTVMARTAWRLRSEGFGLLRKDTGNVCPVPNSSVTVSCDWLVHQPSGTGCDVLISGPGPEGPGLSTPTWCAGEAFDTTRFYAPPDPGGSTPGGGGNEEPPASCDLTDVLKAVDALKAQVAQLKTLVTTLQVNVGKAAYESYNAAVRALEIEDMLRRPPVYTGSATIKIPYLGSAPLTITLNPQVK